MSAPLSTRGVPPPAEADATESLSAAVNASAVLGLLSSSGGGGALSGALSGGVGAGSGRHRAILEAPPPFNSRLGNLYRAFWRMLEAAVASLQDPRMLGPALADSAPMRTFTELTAVKAGAPHVAPAAAGLLGMDTAFAQLPASTQNMVLALVDVNMRLTAQEAQLHEAVSAAYAQAARDASACVTQALAAVRARDAQQAERIAALHARAVQSLLGTRYAWLVSECAQLTRRAADVGVEAPAAPDPTAEAVLTALQLLKRGVTDALEMAAAERVMMPAAGAPSAAASAGAAAAAAAADARLAVRVQKHALAARKAAEIARLRHDPIELARVLRYFAAAEEELSVALRSDPQSAPPPPAAAADTAASTAAGTLAVDAIALRLDERRAELAALLPAVSDLTDQAHIVAAEAHHLRLVLQRQVRDEVSADREATRATALRCLAALQQQLSHAQAVALAQHETSVAAAAAAERTLAAELAKGGGGSHGGASLQVCLRAVGDAAHTQRHTRDAGALYQHKADLHRICLALRECLSSVRGS